MPDKPTLRALSGKCIGSRRGLEPKACPAVGTAAESAAEAESAANSLAYTNSTKEKVKWSIWSKGKLNLPPPA